MNQHSIAIPHQMFAEYRCFEEKIRFRNVESLNKIIDQLIHDGPSNLQVITDFDYTLSKTHANGKPCFPAADIIRQSPFMSDEFKARARQRYDKLLPIELDPSLTIEEKTPSVIKSFQEGFADLVDTGKLTKERLAEMIENADDKFQLRHNVPTTLGCLHEANIPTLIFSAGFGDLVEGVLRKHALNYPNIHVIANFMEFNEQQLLVGFKEPLIHTYNKNESVIPQNCQYFGELAHRNNVILLGDSIGDVSMAQGVHKPGNILKIGFLNDVDEKQLEIFLEIFDIVLLDDQTMDFVNLILNKIIL